MKKLLIVLVLTLLVAFGCAPEAMQSRSPQSTNLSPAVIANREHNETLGAKQVTILTADGDGVLSFGSPSTVSEWSCPSDGCTATFATSTTITLASLPVALTDSSQIVYIRQIKSDDTSVVYTNGSGGVTLTHSAGTLTIHGVTTPFVAGDVYEVGYNALPHSYDSTLNADQVMIVDDTGAQVTAFGSPSTVATHRSPEDFTATYTSSTTITLASLPSSITDDSQLVYIRVVPSSGDAAVYVNGSGSVTMRESASVVTISGAGTPFASGDAYEVGLNLQDKAYDDTTDVLKTQEQSPVYDRRTDVTVVEDTPQDVTTGWVDVGAEQDCRGYHQIGGWWTFDINDAQNIRVRALAKHTSAGDDEYNLPILTVSSSDVKVEPEYIELNTDANQLLVISVSCDNIIPYVQFQVSAGVAGATPGQVDALYVTKGW